MKCRIVELDTNGSKQYLPQYKFLFWWRDFTYIFGKVRYSQTCISLAGACQFLAFEMRPPEITTKRVISEFEDYQEVCCEKGLRFKRASA